MVCAGEQTMGSATTDNEVALTKTISATRERLRVDYRIEPPSANTGRVQLVERFSEPVGRAAISFADSPDGQWEYRDENEVVFDGEFDDAQPIETSLQVVSTTLTPDDCASTVTAAPSTADAPVARSWTDGSGLIPRDNGHFDVQKPPTRDTPAIGIVATGENTAAVARATIRATELGVPVFVAVDSEHGTAARVAERLGATVVQLDIGDRDRAEFSTALLSTARQHSCPGLIFHGDGDERLAVEASIEQFRTTPEAIVDSVLEAEQTNVLVGIPAYNEAETVGTVVERATPHADEVLVVDDGSTDGTAAKARQTDAAVVEHGQNGGYGKALKTIFTEADQRDVDSLVILDADDQHDTSDIPRLLDEQVETDADIVIGSRFGESTETDLPLYRRFGLFVITALTNVSLGSVRKDARIKDTQSGFRCYSGAAVGTLADNTAVIDDRMSASVDILTVANENGLGITEVPTTITYDVSNASTQNPVTHGLTVVNTLITTLERNRPLTAFGIPGVVLVLTGVAVSQWPGTQSLAGGLASVGVTLLAALLVLAGVLSSMLSVVQHSLNTARKDGS